MITHKIKNIYKMLKNQWKSFSELKQLQNRKLQQLVNHAYYNVSYYRNLFDSVGLKPDHINNIEDLKHLPTTSKKQLQNSSLEEIIDRKVNLSHYVQITTSGSTGIPLQLFYAREDFSVLNMNWLRPLIIYEVKPWHRKFEITGPHNITNKRKWYHYLGLWNYKMVSVFESPQEWVTMWYEYKPDILYGYSGSLKLFAKYVAENEIPHINPRFIFGVSDLVDDECRELINTAFKKNLIDLYGAAEAGCIAWECELCKGYHINMDTVIVEFLQSDKPVVPGSSGRIVVTNLHSFAMPIIRYELEDIGRSSGEKSLCGRELPLMEVIEGRSDAVIVLPSGNLLSPMFFFGIMKPVNGMEQWRVLQRDINHLTVLIVPSKHFSVDTINHIKHRVEENIGEKMEIKVELVEKMPFDSSGKVKAVVSEVTNNAF